jgi:transposase
VTGRAQYGPGVKAAAVYGRGAQFLPFARVSRLLGDLCGARVSTGFVHAVVTEAARRLGPFTSHLAALLHVERVLHVDETPARLGGGFKYVHVACTPMLTSFHFGGRSKADIDAGGVLPGFDGTIVRDGYAAYQHLRDAEHAWCGAHLIRDLRAVHEQDPPGQAWAEVMADTLLMAKTMTEQAVTDARSALTDDEISHIRACYAGAVAYGRQQNPPNRHGELSKAGKLVERFHTHRGMILRFVVDLAVPFTNNQAERDLRPVNSNRRSPAPGAPCKDSPTSPPSGLTCPPPPNTARTHSTYSNNCSPPARGCPLLSQAEYVPRLHLDRPNSMVWHRTQIQRPPSPTPPTGVIADATAPAPPAATPCPLGGLACTTISITSAPSSSRCSSCSTPSTTVVLPTPSRPCH